MSMNDVDVISHSEARTMKGIGAGLAILNVAAKSAYGTDRQFAAAQRWASFQGEPDNWAPKANTAADPT
jgi:hypothetical protein